MDDYVIFKRDIAMANDFKNVIFRKNVKYLILSEDEEFIYVNSKPNTNECSAFPKADEGFLFHFA